LRLFKEKQEIEGQLKKMKQFNPTYKITEELEWESASTIY
jgi:hypothetical protein